MYSALTSSRSPKHGALRYVDGSHVSQSSEFPLLCTEDLIQSKRTSRAIRVIELLWIMHSPKKSEFFFSDSERCTQ